MPSPNPAPPIAAETTSDQPGVVTLYGSYTHDWTYHPKGRPTIVMVHGFRGTHEGLADIIKELPEFRVIIPDLPGFGDSTPLTKLTTSLDGYVEWLAAFIEALSLGGPVVLLGHSMGTIVAAKLAADRPELVSRLILVNAIAEAPLHGTGRLQLTAARGYHWVGAKLLPARLGRHWLDSRLLLRAASAYMVKTKNRAVRRAIHATHLANMIKYSGRELFWQVYDFSLRHGVRDFADHITAPTLLVAGVQDTIAPLAGQRRLAAALAHAQLVELPNVGHIVHYEQPAAAAAAIRTFLNA